MSCIHFLNMPVDFAKVFLLAHKVLLAPPHNGEHNHKSQKTCQHCGKRHPAVRYQHHNKTSCKQHDLRNKASDTLV